MKRLLLLPVLLLLLLTAACGTEGGTDPQGRVLINEVMAADDCAYFTQDGRTCDWVELVNGGSMPADLAGMVLTKDPAGDRRYRIPERVLLPGECLLIECGTEHGAGFGISRSGDELFLLDARGAEADHVNLPFLEANEVFRRDGSGAWEKSTDYTPGLPNSSETIIPLEESPVRISEVMTHPAREDLPGYGICDWIEVVNTGTKEYDLSGCRLSDDPRNVRKWTFPEGTVLAAGEALAVPCGRELTGFSLSAKGETVILSDPAGRRMDAVTCPETKKGVSWALIGGKMTECTVPTPGAPNGDASGKTAGEAQHTRGVYLNEICSVAGSWKHDWLELFNASASDADLSGWGLSDDAEKPMKWTFPEGTVIPAGGYLAVWCDPDGVGESTYLCASFSLGDAGDREILLTDRGGELQDGILPGPQYRDVSFGRTEGDLSVLRYFDRQTPGAANPERGYVCRAPEPVLSRSGGFFEEGTRVTVSVSGTEGFEVRYTLDCSLPMESSPLFEGEMTFDDTAILRLRAFGEDALPSYAVCASYLFSVSHTVRVVSLVSDPEGLFSDESGIMVKGPNCTGTYPYYKDANFLEDWEREAHVELFSSAGDRMLSQECGIRLQGVHARAIDQKSFRVYARRIYSGEGSFECPIFSGREYTSYGSFVLRATSQDAFRTRMRDSVLDTLADGTSVPWQETEVCVVYLNGEYWGHYNLRERLDTETLCRFEGWEGREDDLDYVKKYSTVLQGSNRGFEDLVEWVRTHDMTTNAAYERLDAEIDLNNYMEFMAIQIFTANEDTVNVRRYRDPEGDGKWHYALYDLDRAGRADTDTFAAWMTGKGVTGLINIDLFRYAMKNPRFRDEFLTVFGRLLTTTMTTENLTGRITARYELLLPEMEKHAGRWNWSVDSFKKYVKEFYRWAEKRPGMIIDYIVSDLKLSADQKERYFGEALRMIGSAD